MHHAFNKQKFISVMHSFHAYVHALSLHLYISFLKKKKLTSNKKFSYSYIFKKKIIPSKKTKEKFHALLNTSS